MAEGDSGTADRMKKGQGISSGFKTVGLGNQGDQAHPEVTGIDPLRRGPGRPPINESSFRVVGKTAEQENRSGSTPD